MAGDWRAAASSLDQLQRRWEQEVLAQFTEDGGNREQALNYQLFSWELCWQARAALRAAGRSDLAGVEERLRRAARFYVEPQVPTDPWDYGDSDGAFVAPLFAQETAAIQEWHNGWRRPQEARLSISGGTAERATLRPFSVPSPASLPA